MNELKEKLLQQIIALVEGGAPFGPQSTYAPSEGKIPYAGRVYGTREITNLIEAALDFWLTEGPFAKRFEAALCAALGVSHAVLVNSGSSANLAALSALTSPLLGERRLQPGDEVITVAAAFPTTIAPIVQNRLIPVFADVGIGGYNAVLEHVKKAVSPRTKAIFLAHTLGNPFDVDAILEIARNNKLWVVEDNCDALGSQYRGQMTGSFGDLATLSFYPAHHITTGEGGAVVTRDPLLARIVRSISGWGRDCYCPPGSNDTCGQRFTQQHGQLPLGYDHKYVYSHIGYNFHMTEMQAAIGCAQIERLSAFVEARNENFVRLWKMLAPYDKHIVLPQATPASRPAWFAFPISVKKGAPFQREQIVAHLCERNIETRNLFCGNALRHPAFGDIAHRIACDLENTDRIMTDTFFVGVYPGLREAQMDAIGNAIISFLERF